MSTIFLSFLYSILHCSVGGGKLQVVLSHSSCKPVCTISDVAEGPLDVATEGAHEILQSNKGRKSCWTEWYVGLMLWPSNWANVLLHFCPGDLYDLCAWWSTTIFPLLLRSASLFTFCKNFTCHSQLCALATALPLLSSCSPFPCLQVYHAVCMLCSNCCKSMLDGHLVCPGLRPPKTYVSSLLHGHSSDRSLFDCVTYFHRSCRGLQGRLSAAPPLLPYS